MKHNYVKAINDKKEQGLYRSPVVSDVVSDVIIKRGDQRLISFACNDYFSLSHHPVVKKAAVDAIEKHGVGARASRYVTGNNSLYGQVEKQLAKMKDRQDAIVFASGYAAAIGVIPALVGKGDLIVADRLIHSSLIDGAKLSGAKMMRFLHNDIEGCRRLLEENRSQYKKCLIMTETVFSMDGDRGRVEKLLDLAVAFDGLLVSDAAHDLFSPRNDEEKKKEHHLQMGTFSKAVGTLGGYACGDAKMIDYLRNFAKSAIYSTALPPAVLAATLASLHIIEAQNPGQQALKNAQYFAELMDLDKPESAIVVMIIGDNQRVVEIAQKVEEEGFIIASIRPPTVEVGKARLRMTFSSKHQPKQIEALALILKKIIKNVTIGFP